MTANLYCIRTYPTGARWSFRCCADGGRVCHKQKSGLVGIKGLQFNLVGFAHRRRNSHIGWPFGSRHVRSGVGGW